MKPKTTWRELLLVIEVATLTMALCDAAYPAEYELPKGVPVRSSQVEWYSPTDLYQDFAVGSGALDVRNRRTSGQHWNDEFPWKSGGVDQSDNATTFKFHKRGIKLTQHVVRGKIFDNDRASYMGFALLPGEYVGEVIQTDDRTTEVRLLEGNKAGQATFRVFRPYRTFEDIEPFVTAKTLEKMRLRNEHSVSIIDETRLVVDVTVSDAGVKEILGRRFTDVTDVVFAETVTGEKCFAPTTKQRRGIVPRHYTGGFFASKNCFACHATAGTEGRTIDHNPRPDKYGNIRGGGFIFSLPLIEWSRQGKISKTDQVIGSNRLATGITKINMRR